MAELITNVELAAQSLRNSKLVAFATETVYGLGANALDELAVAKVFEAKQRPHFDPLIVHLASRSQLNDVVREIPDRAILLMDKFWPGPLTLVLPKQPEIADLVTAGLDTVAVRIPNHPLAQELLALANTPVAAPSANPFGRISPTNAEHVMQYLGDRIDYVLDGGSCQVGLESTVLKVTDEDALLLRPGGLPVEEIERVIGPVQTIKSSNDAIAQVAPGMLSQHYAPRTPLQVVEDWAAIKDRHRSAALLFSGSAPNGFQEIRVLSLSGSLTEAASCFFATLRELDESGVESIFAQQFPDEGLGIALNDRLNRAAK